MSLFGLLAIDDKFSVRIEWEADFELLCFATIFWNDFDRIFAFDTESVFLPGFSRSQDASSAIVQVDFGFALCST